MAVLIIDRYIGLFGTGLCRFCIWVELPVQRRLCSIFVKNVGSPNIHQYFASWRVVNGPPGFGALHCVVVVYGWDRLCTLGRAPRTKETLLDFHE